MADPVAFIGVGFTTVERRSSRSILDFAIDAVLDALNDAGLNLSDVDGLAANAGAPNPGALHRDNADELSPVTLTQALGIERLEWQSSGGAFAVDMAAAASDALRAGRCRYVVGVRALYNVQGRRYAATSLNEAWGRDQFALPFGAGPGGTRFATRAQRYMSLSGATRLDLFEIVKAAREHAARNPVAYFRGQLLDEAEYLDSRMIAEPLCLYDCDIPICGAGAFVMCKGSDALRGPHAPAYLVGHANRTNGDEIFARSSRSRQQIQVCQLYDGYSPMLYEWLERLGWCEPLSAWRFVKDGNTRLGGSLPTNTFGGSLGEGRLHGMGHLREAVLQVMHRAGDRQVPDVENCLVQIGPFDLSSLAILSRYPD